MTAFIEYAIWRQQHGSSGWLRTAHTVKARSDREAQSRISRKFAGAGFTAMALVAVPSGTDPNSPAR